ncbi:MAG: undecaprenyl-phosphate glucose phosphotransferase [Hyphomicrobiaceae bacterium]|nr:undecaprenyl-phosphate glucose phosphotransferase [Hyphomicrobiaceae bacterium]
MSTTSTTTTNRTRPAPILEVSEASSGMERNRYSRTVAMDVVGLGDIAAVIAGTFLPASIFHAVGELALSWPQVLQSGLLGGFVAHLWLRNAGYYDTSRVHDLPHGVMHLLTAIAIAVAVVTGIGMPLEKLYGHIFVWYVAWVSASFTLILVSRGIAHAALARLTKEGKFDRNIAVFGAGAISRRVHDRLKQDANAIHFVGVYDDRIGDERIDTEGLEIRGKLDDLLAAAYEGIIDDIVVALPQGADNRASAIVRKLEQAPCNVHIVTHIASELVPSRTTLHVSQIGDVGLLDVKERALSDWAPMVKRIEDIAIAALGLIIAVPILLVSAILIKLEDNGPVFFLQRRRGLNRRVIEIVKLRTLKASDSDDKVRQVTIGDGRVTRIGRFLRRTSIDELPQLWNVLKGEMSIVGPRPHALIHDEQFGTMLEEYANRHQVKPGITGLAQVKGLRGETRTVEQIKDRVEQDVAYVKSWSLWLDLQIIAKTLIIVSTGKNAH